MIMKTMNISTQPRRLLAIAVLGALAAGFAGLSAAADQVITESRTVTYGDLNLSNPKGASELYRRIVAASHEVCGSSDNLGELAREQACRRKAIADAVIGVGEPGLIAVYNAKNRQPLLTVIVAER